MSTSEVDAVIDAGSAAKICEYNACCDAAVATKFCSECGIHLCDACSDCIHSIINFTNHPVEPFNLASDAFVALEMEFAPPDSCQAAGCTSRVAFCCNECGAGINPRYMCEGHERSSHVFAETHVRTPGAHMQSDHLSTVPRNLFSDVSLNFIVFPVSAMA